MLGQVWVRCSARLPGAAQSERVPGSLTKPRRCVSVPQKEFLRVKCAVQVGLSHSAAGDTFLLNFHISRGNLGLQVATLLEGCL